MKAFAKTISIIIGLLGQAASIVLGITLILNEKYYAVIVIPGMRYYELLLFNVVVFTAILAAIGFVLNIFVGEYVKNDQPVDFPVVYEALPVISAGVSIFFVFKNGADTKEIILGTVLALLFAALSAVVILYVTKILRLFPKEK